MAHGVLLALRGDIEADVAAAVAADRRFTVSRRCADLAEALAAAEAGVGSVAALSAQSHLNRAVVKRMAKAGVATVGVAADAAEHEALAALGLGIVVPVRDGAAAVVDALTRAVDGEEPARGIEDAPAPGDAASQPGVIIAVWGPVGAPGRTTTAIEIAAAAAAASGGAVLVDADTYGASIAQRLGMLDEAPGIAALARAGASGTVAAADVARHALEVSPGLRVASGLSRPDRWAELSGAALEPVWEALRSESPVTVVDCGFSLEATSPEPGSRNAATLSALEAADVVVAVGSADPVGIQRLVHGLGELGELGAGGERVVVANRLRASVAGPRPSEAIADALARYAGVTEVWTVPNDQKTCDAAMLAGTSLVEKSPESPAAEALRAVAGAALATARTVPTPAP